MQTETPTRRRAATCSIFAWPFVLAIMTNTAPAQENLRSDSKTPFVHRISLYDEDGVVINPRDPRPEPYSPAKTCAKCHAYGSISHGFHFNELDADARHGRSGEPWIWVDEPSGTILPLSYRGWHGVFRPEEVGLSHWDMTKRFGRHSPGGGFGEPPRSARREAQESVRWDISGALEIDCLACHAADRQHDMAERARQIDDENFKWAATAAAGLGVIRGRARNLPDDYDPLLGPSPDYPDRQPPTVTYDLTRFDANDRVFFDLTRSAPIDRCNYCHTVSPVGERAGPRWTHQEDVHLKAGMSCVDCHRNDIGHAITRGYDGEASEFNEPLRAAFSCSGCHVGVPGAEDPQLAMGGWNGAPRPLHRGMPTIHFEKLTCTACHSGPWPDTPPTSVHTALAHGLGLTSRDRSADTSPPISEPVFMLDESGRLAPHRVVQAAYWARETESGARTPLPVRRVAEIAARLMRRAEGPPDRDAMAEALAVLPGEGRIVYVRGREHHPLSPNVAWPLAHAVRPASQSLGVRGCTDCHSDAAAMFTAGGEMTSEEFARVFGADASLLATWNRTFSYRPLFKAFAVIMLAPLAGVLLHYGLAGLGGRRA